MKTYKVLQNFQSEGHPDFTIGSTVSLEEDFAAPHVADHKLELVSHEDKA